MLMSVLLIFNCINIYFKFNTKNSIYYYCKVSIDTKVVQELCSCERSLNAVSLHAGVRESICFHFYVGCFINSVCILSVNYFL